MGDRVILTQEDIKQFENALFMLDTSLNELYQVADTMVPEQLAMEGLKNYLTGFCNRVEKERNIKINLEFVNDVNLPKKTKDISVFRIIKALVDYTLKYSEASEISILLTIEGHKLNLQFANNGKGFDLSGPNISGAKEIAYIKLWVAIIKGKFQILPEPTKGSEVFIELNLKN
jgi:two-component system NarL family sensor kinase